MKQIKPASIARIHTHECFTFLMDVLNFLQLIPEEGKTDKLLQAINQLDETFQAFDDAIHVDAGLSGTLLAREADAACLKSWRNLRAFVEVLTEHPDPEIKAAAQKARYIIRERKDAAQVSRAERNVICTIIAHNLREMPEESIQMMGLEGWLADLEKKIRLFEEARPAAYHPKHAMGAQRGATDTPKGYPGLSGLGVAGQCAGDDLDRAPV